MNSRLHLAASLVDEYLVQHSEGDDYLLKRRQEADDAIARLDPHAADYLDEMRRIEASLADDEESLLDRECSRIREITARLAFPIGIYSGLSVDSEA